MESYTEAEKREAFEDWDAFRPRFQATVEGVVNVERGQNTLLANPLVMLIYADGYLRGKRSGDSPSGVKQLRQRNQELTAMIEELVWAMHLWQDSDNWMSPDAYLAFLAAIRMTGIPFTDFNQDDDHGGQPWRFDDLDWVQRQREVWQQRQHEAGYRI